MYPEGRSPQPATVSWRPSPAGYRPAFGKPASLLVASSA
jgi:hypothetical protein